MKNRKLKLRENESGISEVVATLLVLVITVALFSSIFAWINALPPPMSKTYTEFSAKLDAVYAGGNYTFYVNITHAGGEPLYASATTILISIENFSQTFTLSLNDGNKDGTLTDGVWQPGEVWRWNSTPTYNATSTVIVQIIDRVKNLLVWSNILYPQATQIPPAILERGITPDPVGVGGKFKVWAIVKDEDLNFDSVYVNLSAIGISVPVKMNYTFGWRFETSNITCNAQAGRYLALINATDTKGQASTATLSITVTAVTQDDAQPPRLIVERILLTNFSPTRGDTITITAIIKNLNSMPAISSNVSFWDYIPLTDTWKYIGWVNVSVAGFGQSQAYMYWTATPGGLHKLFVNITSVMPGNSAGIGANISIVVTPKILLVDDDGAVMGSGSEFDVASYMAAALDAANLNYRIYSVPFGLDGPKYDSGPIETQMQYYDVVIWVGGNTNNSLTSNDTSELIKFMSGSPTIPAGKLWLVGQNILEGASSTFLNYVGVNGLLPAAPLPAQIYGQNPGTEWINLSNCQPSMNGTTFTIVRPINPLASLNVKAVFMNGSADRYYGIQYKNVISGREYKVVTFTFEFAAMRDMGDQAITAYKVVNWLSGLGNRTGEDLAVASQYIVPKNPRYMQSVNISATVRNNGASVQSNVEVVAYIYVSGALLDTVSPVNSSITLQPDGGSQIVNFTWVPRMVGVYVIRVVVDPNNKVTETNEENNVLSQAVGIQEVNVLYTVLVVDDDSSTENGGGGTLPNVAQYVINALTSLGYVNGTDMDIQKVPRGADRNNTAYNVSNYNCILWITGNASNGSGYNTLTATDMQIIKDFYLPSDPTQHTFILIGREVLGDSGVAGTSFMTQVLGAASAGTRYTDVVNKTVYGVKESPVTNGMSFVFNNGTSFPCFAYTKTVSAIPLFWANGTTYWDRSTDYVMGTMVKDISGWHSAFLAFDLSYTTNFSLVKEILFNLIHWGGRIDAIPELRVTAPDIYAGTNSRPYIILPELNPQIGTSYLLKANITNVGGLSADVIVRFLDGDTIINSVNIHVPASYADASNNVYNGKCVAEIIWTPLYAGYECIAAIVDPDYLYLGSEKLRENNNASQRIQVFFFYDDMEVPERTADNWNHDATLLNINGETPLDFLARRDVSTRVIGDWDWNRSGSRGFTGGPTYNGNGTYLTNNDTVLNYTGGAAHTTPTAYWLPEVPMMDTGQKKPIDLVIVFDRSGSMTDTDGGSITRLQYAKDAAKAAVGLLGPGDRIAIVSFSGSVSLLVAFTYTNTSTDRSTINTTIDGISASGATSLFDASSYATYYMDINGRPDAVKGIIFLTDGVSNDDADTSTTYYKYAPGTGSTGDEPEEPGPVQYYDAGNGLCGMPYNVFTVSIGNTPDARMHSISLTNSNNISYGVVTTDSSKLSALFQMFVEKLQLASTGDVTVIEPKPTHTPCAIGKPGIKGISISDMPFVVFADGFRSKNWSAPMLGTWVQWTRTGTWSVNEWNLNFDGYRTCAYTSASGNTLYTMVNPSTVLAKLSNTQTAYTIKQVNVSFLAYGSMAFDVSTDGSTWTQVVGSTAYNSVYTRISITSYINPTQPFYIRFRSTSWVYIDDVIVQYVLDTQDASGSGGGAAPGNYTISPAKYRYLVTPEVNITNASNATLSFYTKYAITEGTNGGFIYLWVKLPGESTWTWDANHRIYILPKQSYGGNLKMSGVANESTTGGLDGTTGLIDRYGRLPYWCFNGKSAGGTYGWAKVEADLSKYISNFTAVRAVFVFAQFGGQLPPDWRADMGWYIDDVQIKVSGIPTDYWQYVYNPGGGYLGSNRYWYYNQASGYLPLGVDSSLYTIPIDLTRAYRATLIAFFKFNINDGAGMPPDGVRIEVSRDNGETWYSITYGVRIGWGYTGRELNTLENRSYYGVTGDAMGGEFPQRYSGVRGTLYKTNWTFVRATNANTVSAYDWVPSFTLVRLNCDLSGFAGNTIILRIRVFTNATGSETDAIHYASASYNRGVFVDDVFVIGNSIIHGLPGGGERCARP